MLRFAGVLALGLLAGHPAWAQEPQPFRVPNLSPLDAIVGLPVWAGIPETTSFGLTTEIANHYRLSSTGDELLVLDGETLRIRGYLERPIGDNWSLGVDAPFVRQSGGILDDLIDGWHSTFGMPDGGRNHRPEGVLAFELADTMGSFYERSDSGSGLGDIRLSVARRLVQANGWTMRFGLKLPTGHESLLAGSGAADFGVSVLKLRSGDVRGHTGGLYYGAALVEIGQPKLVRFRTRQRTLAAVLGLSLALTDRLGIQGQVDVNSPVYESGLNEIGLTAAQATIGGWLTYGRAARFDFAVSEDLHVGTAPDVVLVLGFNWRR